MINFSPRHRELYTLIVDFITLSQPFTRQPNNTAKELDMFDSLQVELVKYFVCVACACDTDGKQAAKDFSIVASQLGIE